MSATSTTLRGIVERQRVAEGSKSERTALVLVCDDRTVILRRLGDGAFGDEDPEVASLVGEHASFSGTLRGNTLLFTAVG